MRRPSLGVLFVAVVAAAPALAASSRSPAAVCQAQLQRLPGGTGVEEALRACVPLFREPGCRTAWSELLDAPGASPGYGRAASVARMADSCVRAYCRFEGMGRQQLCTGQTPPPVTAEFFTAWRAFQTEVLRREHVPASTSERLVRGLQLWAGFQPRSGTRSVLQAITRPEVPGVVALTLWSAQGEQLGAWVTDVLPDETTLRSLQAAVPRPPAGEGASRQPCVRLEAPGSLPPATADALLKAVGEVCPADVVTVRDA
jgi:hypothetical protein